jgi:uncharacterized protein (DUF1684 family)
MECIIDVENSTREETDTMIFQPAYRFLVFFLLILTGVLGVSCSKSGNRSDGRVSEPDTIPAERASRDDFFRSSADSPIPKEERPAFQGLDYYPIDESLRFSVRLNRYSRPKQVRLGTNTGEIRSGLRYGYFDFAVEGQSCRLQVYRLEDAGRGGAPSLFIPFRDETSGSETYGPGRYIDLTENTAGIYDLDFNRAYNPYCAFNNDYSCPLPPAENRLSVPIKAGEKKYSRKSSVSSLR